MRQNLIKLVDAILRRLEEQPDTAPTESGIRTWLVQQGYNKRDIEDALRLVRPRFTPVPVVQGFPITVRPLSDHEQFKLTMEARNALARLESFGLVDPYEREMILDRINQFDGEVGMNELDYLLSWLVCSSRDVETQQTLYGVLDGSGETYH